MIPDQTPVWDRKHDLGQHENLRHTPSPLARLAEPSFKRQSAILELGCGVGRDAVFFAKQGHHVVATDSSVVVIQQDKKQFSDSGVGFFIVDMRKDLPYETASFDVAYANLSLHYYSHEMTPKIIKEIWRVLKPGGIIAFACKSVEDVHYGNGEEVEKNVFVSATGHVRHLFSINYAQQLLIKKFKIEHLDEVEEDYNGKHSNIVRCIAIKLDSV